MSRTARRWLSVSRLGFGLFLVFVLERVLMRYQIWKFPSFTSLFLPQVCAHNYGVFDIPQMLRFSLLPGSYVVTV